MRHVQDTSREPFDAVGLIQMRWDDGKTYYGSGALVSPSLVLTCAHNFINQDNQPKAQALSATFYPGWNARLPPQGGTIASCALVPAPYPRIFDEWDIALLRLSGPVRLKSTFGLTVTKTKEMEGETVRLTGYPQNRSPQDGLMFDDDDEVVVVDLKTNSTLFTHDTLGGSSGSPVWTPGEVGYHVYAVHNSVHDQDLKRGTLITPKVGTFLQVAAARQPRGGSFVELVGAVDDPFEGRSLELD